MKNGAEIEISDYIPVVEIDITGEHLNSISFNRVLPACSTQRPILRQLSKFFYY